MSFCNWTGFTRSKIICFRPEIPPPWSGFTRRNRIFFRRGILPPNGLRMQIRKRARNLMLTLNNLNVTCSFPTIFHKKGELDQNASTLSSASLRSCISCFSLRGTTKKGQEEKQKLMQWNGGSIEENGTRCLARVHVGGCFGSRSSMAGICVRIRTINGDLGPSRRHINTGNCVALSREPLARTERPASSCATVEDRPNFGTHRESWVPANDSVDNGWKARCCHGPESADTGRKPRRCREAQRHG